jgi:hypothetical protein
MIKTRSHLHMFQRIFKSTKFAMYLYMFIFAIEQDMWVTRSNELFEIPQHGAEVINQLIFKTQVVLVGGRSKPGTIKPKEEGEQHHYSVLT